MPLFVRINEIHYHVPSIYSIKIKRSTILNRPIIYISYYTGKSDIIRYCNTKGCFEKDYLRLYKAIEEYKATIREISLFEEQDIIKMKERTNSVAKRESVSSHVSTMNVTTEDSSDNYEIPNLVNTKL